MAYYSDELIDEVISQNDIVEVISEYVALKKNGRNFVGLCPFHREKTPSFCVSMDKQIFKCFGCLEGGNVISFIMKIENLDFTETLEFLANRAHIDLSKYEVVTNNSKDIKINRDTKDKIFEINREAAKFYNNNLMNLLKDNNNLVKEYIKKRSLDIKTITKFGIGYANGNDSLMNHLLKQGYTKSEIMSSGIFVTSENGKIYDRFFNRLIFPILDTRDRVIAFGGRVLNDGKPKYLNSQENEVYHKGKTLYALNLVRKEKFENIIIVEGYMDAVSLHKSGVNNVVASLGTALTNDQARLLKKYTDNIVIGYDQDGAGQEATIRGLDILSKNKLNVKVLILDKSDVKDPDEYINKYGTERFNNCVKNAISLVEFKISKLEKNLNPDNIDSKIVFLTQVANILAKIDNNIERDLYIDIISKKYNIGVDPIIKEIEKKITKSDTSSINLDIQNLNQKMQLVTNMKKRQEEYIIALLLSKDKNVINKIFENFTEEDFTFDEVREIFKFLLNLYQTEDFIKIDVLTKIKDDDIMKNITDIMYIDINNIDTDRLFNEMLNKNKKDKLIKRREEIIKRISSGASQEEQEVLQVELNQILIELKKLKV